MRPFRKVVQVTGTGVSRVSANVLPYRVVGVLTSVKVRNSVGSVTATIFATSSPPPGSSDAAGEDVLYESSATVFTASATAVDVDDHFGADPQVFNDGLWVEVNETAGAVAWSFEVLLEGMLE